MAEAYRACSRGPEQFKPLNLNLRVLGSIPRRLTNPRFARLDFAPTLAMSAWEAMNGDSCLSAPEHARSRRQESTRRGIGHADAETLTATYRFKAACQLTTTVMGEGSAAGLVWLMRKR